MLKHRRNIGIVTEYDFTEKTWFAMSLGRTLERAKQSVSLVTPMVPGSKSTSGVSFQWDSHVYDFTNWNSFERWSEEQHTVIWLTPHNRMLDICSQNVRHHICVPEAQAMRPADIPFTRACSNIAFSTQDMFKRFQFYVGDETRQWYLPCDSDYPLRQRNQFVRPGQQRVLLPLIGTSAMRYLPLYIAVFTRLMRRLDSLHLEFLFGPKLTREQQRLLAPMAREFGSRLKITDRPDDWKLFNTVLETDWLFSAAPQVSYGFLPALALTCGVSLLVYDTKPLNQWIYTSGKEGVVIPCEKEYTRYDLEYARPTAKHLFEFLYDVFSDTSVFLNTHQCSWSTAEKRRKDYYQFMSQLYTA